MVREIGNRVKISDIIINQLPDFINDTISTVEETVNAESSSGTYTKSNKTVTIDSKNHGLSIGQRIYLEYISGSASSGYYSVSEVINPDIFRVVDNISGSTSGTVNYKKYSQILSQEKRVIRSSPGSYDKFIAFLRQYYISQEYQGGPVDIIDNFNDYTALDNLIPEVVVDSTNIIQNISQEDEVIKVTSTKGFPKTYGLIKINDEIITYTSKDSTTFYGCIRGFSGITNYHDDANYEELVFSTSDASSHDSGAKVLNLSVLFLREFYKKIKYSLVPGLENTDFVENLNVGNFLKEARSLYETKGTEESFKILFKILFGIDVSVIDLEKYLIKPSDARYIRRSVSVVEVLSGNPFNLRGQTVFKENDEEVSASISNVEILTRDGKVYYKLYLFVGYDDDKNYITGNFNVTSSSKSLDEITVTESSNEVVTVDSTIGFPKSGYFLYENKKIFYSDKTLTQFLGCNSEFGNVSIKKTGNITSSDLYYGYENGDLNKKVNIRFGGVLQRINFLKNDESDRFNYLVGDEIFVKSLGEVIDNPSENPTDLQIFSNSWIYNTSCRFQIQSIDSGSQITLYSSIDKSNLKPGDFVEILTRGTENVVVGFENVVVNSVSNKSITLGDNVSSLVGGLYDIRRLQNKSKVSGSSSASIKYGNNKITSDILNLYKEENSNNFSYVASNSLPSYEINPTVFSYSIQNILGYNNITGKYSIIEFSEPVSFLEGESVQYTSSGNNIDFLSSDEIYYVEVVNSEKTQIRLYLSRSFIGTSNYIEFGPISGTIPAGNHLITLYSQRNSEITPQKILRKFHINPEVLNDEVYETPVGPIGMLVNGVEILNYKSNDKIYYGPISRVNILNGGSGYDVINPPLLEFSEGNAKIQPVVTGSFEKVLISPQQFDISEKVIVDVTGGNGEGAVLEPVISKYQREVLFDARGISNGGGIDVDLETITFLSEHNFINGQEIIYDSNQNSPLGISSYQVSNLSSGRTLINNTRYFASIVNSSTIQLYQSFNDYLSGINTVGITTVGNSGIHKFKTLEVNTLSDIIVSNPGSGYSNRKLIVKPSGISTEFNTINFKNHGFSDGEIVTYSVENIGLTTSIPVSGLSTQNSYYILKVDDNIFQLSDAGVGATISSNYLSRKGVIFENSGEGYHVFNYPKISINILYSSPGIGSTSNTFINATPIVRGSIDEIYVYEEGVGYGSTIINTNISPDILIKTGKNAKLLPIIVSGSIVDIQILSGGTEYYSYPDIVVSSKNGRGAVLKPIIQNNSIVDVEILNPGVDYDNVTTTITVVPTGRNAKFETFVRDLTINNCYKYGKYFPAGVGTSFYRKLSDEVFVEIGNNTNQYFQLSYSSKIMNEFNENSSEHSPIIGWSYDGYPIYGPYGYSNPEDVNSPIKKLESGYLLSSNNVVDRPNKFDLEFFVDDFIYNNSGDLDEYNGRFCKTPEFPNGIYAYFATVKNDPYSGTFIGDFPYFIGNNFRSFYDKNSIDTFTHDYDFNSSNLIRNTFPYKVNDFYADNDFIIESNEILSQKSIVESINFGKIDGFSIINSGDNYSVDDKLVFENEPSLVVKVSEVLGKDILEISTSSNLFTDSVISRIDDNRLKVTILPHHNLQENDNIVLSGFSTSIIDLSGTYRAGFSTYTTILSSNISSASSTGIVTTFSVYYIPTTISIGSSIKINSENFEVIDVYSEQSSFKVRRSISGTSHTQGDIVEFLPTDFEVNFENSIIPEFDSKTNDIAYFNSVESIGIGTISGITSSVYSYVNGTLYEKEVPTQSIYVRNHPFKTNQKVILTKDNSSSQLLVSSTSGGATFNIPSTGNSEVLYVINKSKDFIGLVTSVGLTTQSNGLFFVDYSGTEDYLFKLESDYTQEFCDVSKIQTTVVTKEEHNLSELDEVKIKVFPKNNTGLSTANINLKYNSDKSLLLVNEVNISSGISTVTNTISLSAHGYETGDLVYYDSTDSTASGLSTGKYFIVKVDDNKFKLSDSYIDSINPSPKIVNIGSNPGGSGQTISKINPSINVYKNNDLTFNLSDSSLVGFNFKIYYDSEFKKEFVSVSGNENFSIAGVGTVGISTNASLTIKYSNNLPNILFYTLEKSGFISTADKSNPNFSKIEFVESKYNNSYTITGIGSTTFSFSLRNNPEILNYKDVDCDVIEYTTNSKTATGPITNVKTFSIKRDYLKLPNFLNVNSQTGSGAFIIPTSTEIGRPKEIRIVSNGFDYPSDNTLRPSASIPTEVILTQSHIIESIDIISGGNNYLTPPDIIVINPETLDINNTGIIKANLSGSTIGSVNVDISPKRLPEKPAIIKTINNTNGVFISEIQSSLSGIVTCKITTPISGFEIEPFEVGDKIFVENIEKYSLDGDGFNSSNYEYQFFTVSAYNSSSNPREIQYNLSGLTTNPGIAKTIQGSFASIINEKNYPKFKVNQKPASFNSGEKIVSDYGFGFEERNMEVKVSDGISLRLSGTHDFSIGEIIRGKETGSEGVVNEIRTASAKFEISSFSQERLGWFNDTGKLNEISQVIEDNDYYQNLSYSVKSIKTWDEISSPVNSLLHTSGLKNFSDTEIISTANVGIASSALESTVVIISDLITENRVDSINYFDLNVDSDIST